MKEQKNIIYESNGAKAVLVVYDEEHLNLILSTPHIMKELAEEIKAFRKYFWANEHEDWMGVDQAYLHFFTPDMMLRPIDEEGNILFYDDIETGLWQKESKEEEETFSIVTHSCYEPDPYRVYSETEGSTDREYMEKNPSMYTLIKEGLTSEEVDEFFEELNMQQQED